MRILLVEDEPSAAKILAKGLRERGYAVDVSGDGMDAGYKASVNEYDLVILDIMQPDARADSGTLNCRRTVDRGSWSGDLLPVAQDFDVVVPVSR